MTTLILFTLILAQTSPDLPSDWTKFAELGALLSVFGAFMVFVRHMIYVVMPTRETAWKEERAALMLAHQQTLDKLTALFEKHVENCDERCDERHKELVSALSSMRERLHSLAGVIQGMQSKVETFERNSKG